MKIARMILLSLHVLVGIGALVGGFAAIMNPYEPLGMTTDALKDSPFDTYLIPGIILLVLLGIGNLLSAGLFALKWRWQGFLSGFFSATLVFWIVIQCVMLRSIAFQHILFFGVGALMGLLSLTLIFNQRS